MEIMSHKSCDECDSINMYKMCVYIGPQYEFEVMWYYFLYVLESNCELFELLRATAENEGEVRTL